MKRFWSLLRPDWDILQGRSTNGGFEFVMQHQAMKSSTAGLALLDILLQPEVLFPKPKKSLETADALTSRKRIFLRLGYSR